MRYGCAAQALCRSLSEGHPNGCGARAPLSSRACERAWLTRRQSRQWLTRAPCCSSRARAPLNGSGDACVWLLVAVAGVPQRLSAAVSDVRAPLPHRRARSTFLPPLQFLTVIERLGQLLVDRPSRANSATVQVRACVLMPRRCCFVCVCVRACVRRGDFVHVLACQRICVAVGAHPCCRVHRAPRAPPTPPPFPTPTPPPPTHAHSATVRSCTTSKPPIGGSSRQ